MDFARTIKGTSNYYLLITRNYLPQLPYSVDEIYELSGRGKNKKFVKAYSSVDWMYSRKGQKHAGFVPEVVITEDAKAWYDGYELIDYGAEENRNYSMYSPKSVVDAMLSHVYDTYWNQTETYEALKVYIQMNMDGLKDAVIRMLAGERVTINTGTFSNDMTTFAGRGDCHDAAGRDQLR